MPAVLSTAAPPAHGPSTKRFRVRGKSSADEAFAAKYAELATAEELAHPGVKFAPATVRRKHVHWTHGRSNIPAHVQPSAMTRAEFWTHLVKVYKDVYPDPASPTCSIPAFGLNAEEAYATTSAGLCATRKHGPTYSTEQHYWNKGCETSPPALQLASASVGRLSVAKGAFPCCFPDSGSSNLFLL